MADDVTEKNLRELAFDTQKYSGAAIANLVNLAAMRVERDGREKIQYKDLTDVSETVETCLMTCCYLALNIFCAGLPITASTLCPSSPSFLVFLS